MEDSVLQWSQSNLATHPELASFVEESNKYIESKLWHQLTVAIDELISSPEFKSLSDKILLYDLFHHFIKPLSKNFDQYRFAQFAITTAFSLEQSDAPGFLSDVAKLISEDELDTRLLLDAAIGYMTAVNGEVFPALDILVTVNNRMEQTTQLLNHSTHEMYHRAHAIVDKARNRNTDCYNHQLSYLTYTSFEKLSIDEQRKIAEDIAISAILSETVFNFGEFLRYAIVKALDTSSGLHDFLHIMNNGDINQFKQFITQSPLFTNQATSPFAQHSAFLQQKITIIALMNEIFQRASSQRTLSFREIADITQIPLDHVELLAIKAFGLGVLRGSIDSIAKTISFSWVQPRLLNPQQLLALEQALQVSIDNTRDNIQLVIDSIEQANAEITSSNNANGSDNTVATETTTVE